MIIIGSVVLLLIILIVVIVIKTIRKKPNDPISDPKRENWLWIWTNITWRIIVNIEHKLSQVSVYEHFLLSDYHSFISWK